MTAQDAPQAQPKTFDDAVFMKSLLCVTGATGVKTTVLTQPGTEQVTIAADQKNQDAAHRFTTFFQCCASRSANKPLVASRAPGRVLTTMSTAGSCV